MLSTSQIKKLYEEPVNPGKRQFAEAIVHQQRLKFHTESRLKADTVAIAYDDFLDFVKRHLTRDKFKKFKNTLRFPLSTVSLTERIYHELSRVFTARNSGFDFRFTDQSIMEDWLYYSHDQLHEVAFWKGTAWEMMKTGINSLIVVDLPLAQNNESDRPNPYMYFLPVENVIDSQGDGYNFDYVIFKTFDGKVACYDDTFYRVFNVDDDGKLGAPLTEARHNLGYCPIAYFWTTPISISKPWIKKAPITNVLGDLDWLLFFNTGKRALDVYGAYPIFWSFKANGCSFRDETGDHCMNGYIVDKDGNYKSYIDDDGTPQIEKCPVCSHKSLSGAGSYIQVPLPQPGMPDMTPPVGIISADTKSLQYNVDEVNRLEELIYERVTGDASATSGVMKKEAINVEQLDAQFEMKRSILMALKKNFENAQRFVDSTLCRLRYGDAFISCSIDYGTEFYLYTSQELQAMYQSAKESGSPEYRLNEIQDEIIMNESQTNPSKRARLMILKQLEPYPNQTISELNSLSGQFLDRTKVVIKLNFSNFIERFERENINIVDFASNLPMDLKIQKIYAELSRYASEETPIGNNTTNNAQ